MNKKTNEKIDSTFFKFQLFLEQLRTNLYTQGAKKFLKGYFIIDKRKLRFHGLNQSLCSDHKPPHSLYSLKIKSKNIRPVFLDNF